MGKITLKLLNKTQLAKVLNLSSTTLWRALTDNTKKAKKYKLRKCPYHTIYTSGRKYYDPEEVREWLEEVASYMPN